MLCLLMDICPVKIEIPRDFDRPLSLCCICFTVYSFLSASLELRKSQCEYKLFLISAKSDIMHVYKKLRWSGFFASNVTTQYSTIDRQFTSKLLDVEFIYHHLSVGDVSLSPCGSYSKLNCFDKLVPYPLEV